MTVQGLEQETARRRAQVTVGLGERSYNIEIGPGLLGEAGRLIKALPGAAKCAVVSDETVASLHLAKLKTSLEGEGLYAGEVILPPGEATKSYGHLEALCEKLLELQIERTDLVVVFGGGVIGDLAGYAASVLRRGVRFVQIPTSLLAQVDSSVGGKTGINSPHGKNLIGTFHQPSLVLADLDVLETLSPREFRAGYAEIAKYGLIGDETFFTWLESNGPAIIDGNQAARMKAIETSCLAKADIVARDERETGCRALLNLGHTFGHALEGWAGYSGRLLHGEGVSIGMMLAFELSHELGHCDEKDVKRVRAHLSNIGLPVAIDEIEGEGRPDPSRLLVLMSQDKKMMAGTLTFVLARGIGDAFLSAEVPADKLEDFLNRKCAQEKQ